MSLTTDELTVLMIAAQGESMMAIAHWKQPVESLIAKGYLQSRGDDNFNCVITPAGRAACEARDREDMDAFKNAVAKKVRQTPAPDVISHPVVRTHCDLVVLPAWKFCPRCGGVLE